MENKGTIKIEQEYTTSDLCLAVILKMNGCIIKRVEQAGGKRLIFHFENNKNVDGIIKDYYTLNVDSHPYKRFYNEMKEIKNLIYNYPIDKNY